MPLYVRVIDGEVTDVWDTTPPAEVGVDGWRNAVEIKPALTITRERHGEHYFNLDVDPVEICWPVVTFSIDERKELLRQYFLHQFERSVQTELTNERFKNIQFDMDLIATKKQEWRDALDIILSANTHEELDVLIDRMEL
jgi:hypothetical protein